MRRESEKMGSGKKVGTTEMILTRPTDSRPISIIYSPRKGRNLAANRNAKSRVNVYNSYNRTNGMGACMYKTHSISCLEENIAECN